MKAGIFLTVLALGVALNVGAIAGNFTDNRDGTVTDNVTGLIWQQEDDNISRPWEEALTYCNGLTLASHGDWRLPNIKELESITDDTVYDPAIDATYFPGTNAFVYRSSTSNISDVSYAWSVGFTSGNVHYLGVSRKTDGCFVRCVR